MVGDSNPHHITVHHTTAHNLPMVQTMSQNDVEVAVREGGDRGRVVVGFVGEVGNDGGVVVDLGLEDVEVVFVSIGRELRGVQPGGWGMEMMGG